MKSGANQVTRLCIS